MHIRATNYNNYYVPICSDFVPYKFLAGLLQKLRDRASLWGSERNLSRLGQSLKGFGYLMALVSLPFCVL